MRRVILIAFVVAVISTTGDAQARFSAFAEVRDVLAALAAILPQELKAADAAAAEQVWTSWATRQDRSIRSRLQRGDEETIVNWLLFGTTFTKLPRVPLDSPGAASMDEAQRTQLIAARVADLAA